MFQKSWVFNGALICMKRPHRTYTETTNWMAKDAVGQENKEFKTSFKN